MASKKEKVWLREYLKCWNATEAARRAGYKWPNKVAWQKLEKFREEIADEIDRKVMGADEALARLSEIARGVYSEYIKPDGTVDIASMVEDDRAHLISKVYDTQYGKRFEFVDMQSALRDIGKAHGIFREVVADSKDESFDIDNWREERKKRLEEIE